ncbi:hypothetical protein [Bacillus toyonensis]|uniref:hypothetical protein n=1 Tax=Bacillus toyonensis TaxID=155322 RepID=UPI0020D26826|nr:hypothetical protein [Bacillus toyonensis]
MFVSKRGIPLLTQTNERRMLTAEDYGKWYELYVIETDGTVKEVEWNDHYSKGWRDHCIVPESFKEMADFLNASYDDKTWKKVCYMYEENL